MNVKTELKNAQKNVNCKLNEYYELKSDIDLLTQSHEEYIDYLEDLDPKFFKGGEEEKEKQILKKYEEIELLSSKKGLYNKEDELKNAETELINALYNNLSFLHQKNIISTEDFNIFLEVQDIIKFNAVRRNEFLYYVLDLDFN